MILKRVIFQKHLEEGEEILFTAHRHWAAASLHFAGVAFLGFAMPWVLYFMGFNSGLFLKIALLWSFLAIFRLIYVFVDWFADAWIATDMGVIFVEWKGFFSNSSTRVGYADIESVSYEVDGFWPTVFGYGNLTLQSVSGNAVTLGMANNPKGTELAVMRAQEQFINDRDMEDTEALKDLLSKMVAHHMRHGSK